MNQKVLISSFMYKKGLPPQSVLIQRHLHREGYPAVVIGRGESGPARFFDVAVRGFFHFLQSDAALVDVFGHRAFVYQALSVIYAKLTGCRVAVMLRGGWLGDFVDAWPRSSRFILGLADHVVAPHGYLADELRERGVTVDKIIPNFINLEDDYRFRMREQLAPRLLYLRGTLWCYDPEMAVRAFAIVQERYPDASLTFAGKGSTTEVSALAAELGLRNVEFVGMVPKNRIGELADRNDIYFQSNRVENMPITVLEMWACGVPVVCTDAGGTRYLVEHEKNGLLVPPEDPAALAEACFRLLEDPDLTRRLITAGREKVNEYTWEHVGPMWKEALQLGPAPSAEQALDRC